MTWGRGRPSGNFEINKLFKIEAERWEGKINTASSYSLCLRSFRINSDTFVKKSMESNSKVIKFPIFLKNPLTGLLVAILSENDWESLQQIGRKKIHSRHKVNTYADKLYLQDVLSAGWQKISEEDWVKAKADIL